MKHNSWLQSWDQVADNTGFIQPHVALDLSIAFGEQKQSFEVPPLAPTIGRCGEEAGGL